MRYNISFFGEKIYLISAHGSVNKVIAGEKRSSVSYKVLEHRSILYQSKRILRNNPKILSAGQDFPKFSLWQAEFK